MAAVKIKESKTKYVVTYNSESNKNYWDQIPVLFLDHPPEADIIENYANDMGVDINDIEVYELGRKGKLTKTVALSF